MKKLAFVLLLAAYAPAAFAQTINNLGAGRGSVVGTDLFPSYQGANPAVRPAASQIASYVYGLMSGDATAGSGGAVTFATVNANVGSFGSATQASQVTVNAKGLVTAAANVTVTPAVGSITGTGTGVITALGVNIGTAGSFVVNGGALGTPSSGVATNLTGTAAGLTAGNVTTNANLTGAVTSVGNATSLGSFSSAQLLAALTTKTGTGSAVFGSAPTIDSLSATTAMTLSFLTGGGTQCLTVSNTGAVGGTACAGGGSVTSVTPGAGQVSSVTAACSQTAITVTGTISSAECVNAQVGTTYTIVDGDRAKLVTGSNTASQSYSIAQAGASTTFQSGWFVRVRNVNTGPIVITPTTSTINGAASYTVLPGQTVKVTSDGTNYQTDAGSPTAVAVNSQTGVNYAILSSDNGKLLNLSNASNQVPTIAQAGSTGFPTGWYVEACNQGAGTQTITPTTSTIGGASTYVLPAASAAAPACVGIVSDGSNYQVVPDFFRFGTGVATAAGTALSAAGGLTTTIASGTAVLGTSAIASAACATLVTVSATNTATTDVVLASFNGDTNAVTGYIPSTSGMLTIKGYPTANNVNFSVCNNTSASVTPGAITLNWKVVR